ncbi:hypothetical protein Tco_1150151 [Tanacetum coccineum]
MLATGRYAQWQSRFMRYIDTRLNCKDLKQCIYDGPYVMTKILVPEKPARTTKEAVPAHTMIQTYKNTTGTDNQEKDEKQSQNNKTGLGMEKL